MNDKDLFGDVPPAEQDQQEKERHRRQATQRGYANRPGTGPDGHTCGDCAHIYRTVKYRKCELMRKHWSHGYATDILARSPACSKWKGK